jgi:hypothetical protein
MEHPMDMVGARAALGSEQGNVYCMKCVNGLPVVWTEASKITGEEAIANNLVCSHCERRLAD